MTAYDFNVNDVGPVKQFSALRGGVADSWSAAVVECYAEKPNGARVTLTGNYAIVSQGAGTFSYQPDDPSRFDVPGTWLLQPHVVDGTEDYLCDTITISVGPKIGTGTPASITLTSGTAAQINTAISALSALGTATTPAVLHLPQGNLTVSEAIELQSYVSVRGAVGGTTITASFSGGADTPTNAIIRASETVGAVSTTVAVTANEGVTSLTLASVSGLSAGMWLRISGNDTTLGDPAPGQSEETLITTYEIAQIAALPGGAVVTLEAPTRMHHAAGKTVVNVTPIRNAAVTGVVLNGSTGPVACGVHLRGTYDCRLEDVKGSNFSRALVCLDRGADTTTLERIKSLGGSNGIVYLDAVHGVVSRDVTNDPAGAGFHASGTRRTAYFERNGCTSITLERLDVSNLGLFGAFLWGSRYSRWSDVSIAYCDGSGCKASMAAAGEHDGGGRTAYLWMGAGTLNHASFSFKCSLERVKIVGCVADDTGDCYLFFHDTRQSRLSSFNLDAVAEAGIAYNGLVVHDTTQSVVREGHIYNFRYDLVIQADPADTMISDMTLVPPQTNGLAVISLDTNTAVGISLDRIILITNSWCDAFAFTANLDWDSNAGEYSFTRFETDSVNGGRFFDRLFLAYQPDNHILTKGYLGELQASSTTGQVHVRPPNGGIGTDPSTRCFPVFQGRPSGGAGWVMMQDTAGEFALIVHDTGAAGDFVRPADPTGSDNQQAVCETGATLTTVALQNSVIGRVVNTFANPGWARCKGR